MTRWQHFYTPSGMALSVAVEEPPWPITSLSLPPLKFLPFEVASPEPPRLEDVSIRVHSWHEGPCLPWCAA